MMSQSRWLSGVVTLGIWFGGISLAQAQSSHEEMPSHEGMQPAEQTGEFQRIAQPLWLKGIVTAGGLGLLGLEVWWFLLSKPKSRQAEVRSGIQEVTVTVDGGYEPSQIVVQAGQPVRLKFDRKDPSSCLEEVRFPEFRIAQVLPLNQVTVIEFTPEQPGQYEFTCGMNMFRGVVEVRSPHDKFATLPAAQHSAA